jgi:hypothetical protein
MEIRFAGKAVMIAAVCIVGLGSAGSAEAQVRVPGFTPSTRGFLFSNSFPQVPHFTFVDVFGNQIPIGNAANGLCGGMAFAARDYFEAGLARPTLTSPPSSGPLYDYLVMRLWDSFELPHGPARYLHLMNPDLPDHETWLSMAGLSPHGRAWVTIVEEWPKIKADLDQGHPSPLALIRVKSYDPLAMGQNHQVLAWGYDLVGTDLTIQVYDPNFPNNDYVSIHLNIGNPTATTSLTFSVGGNLYAFFRPEYGSDLPFDLSDGMIIREVSGAAVFAIVGGAKLWIRSGVELNAYFGGWGAVRTVADGVMSAIGDVPLDGTVVRETNRPEVKLIDEGFARWITSGAALSLLGGWGAVRLVPAQSLAGVPNGAPVY